MMKTYIIPQTEFVYCQGLMNGNEPSVHNGEYQGQGKPQFSPGRKLYI